VQCYLSYNLPAYNNDMINITVMFTMSLRARTRHVKSNDPFQVDVLQFYTQKKTKLRGLQSASELYRPSGRRLLAKLVSTFADRECHVVSATDPRGH
jgi:hypothetical protein